MKKPFVISFTGLAHSGKDTSSDYLVRKLSEKGYKVTKVGLADRLKHLCRKLIKMFYSIDISIEDFYDINKKEQIRPELPWFNNQPFTLRTVLQQIGSEIFRDTYKVIFR